MSANLYDELQKNGQLEYGASFEKELVHRVLGLKMPEYGTIDQFQEVILAELAAIDYVRSVLLKLGKYIVGSKSGYRVLLPSENQKQAEAFMRQADKKLNRARLLTQNTPKTAAHMPASLESRILLKQQRARHLPGAAA